MYMVIKDVDISLEMVNRSTSRTKSDMPKSDDSVWRIVETNDPFHTDFSGHLHYDKDAIFSFIQTDANWTKHKHDDGE